MQPRMKPLFASRTNTFSFVDAFPIECYDEVTGLISIPDYKSLKKGPRGAKVPNINLALSDG